MQKVIPQTLKAIYMLPCSNGEKMNKKAIFGITLALLLVGTLKLASDTQPVKATNGTLTKIYIRADGSIDPEGAPISSSDNVTYFLTESIFNKSICVERDNIIFDGGCFTVSGPTEGDIGILGSIGINVTNRNNVIIKNTTIEKFDMGIYVAHSNKITIDGNNASHNQIFFIIEPIDYDWIGTGISVYHSRDIVISNNNVTNNISGISISSCNNTLVKGNKASLNKKSEASRYWGGGISLTDVRNCTLMENVISSNGIIGISIGSGVGYTSFNNTIRNNTITDHVWGGAYSYGISISWSSNTTITENKIFANIYGIQLRYYSKNHTITNNNISQNSFGVYFESSTSNSIINNTFFRNADAIWFKNSANNNKILYNSISNSSGNAINIRDSDNNVVSGNNVYYNSYGVRFVESSNNYIFDNNIKSQNYDGLVLYYYSNNNKALCNNITLNKNGIVITYQSYNSKIYHNNFINNTNHVYTDMNSTWDDDYPSGGNYWSNYTGADIKSGISQDETGSDGIGDTAHIVSEGNNTDRYPLMAPINTFDAGIWDGTTFYVKVISNSTVSNFKINTTEKTISFNVTGETGSGFCRVIIPKTIVEALWLNNYTVLVNGLSVEFKNWTDAKNTYIYFTYPHSKHEVIIIPEFPSALLLLSLIMFATFAVIFTKKRVHKEIRH